jgi:hypothetical protein
MMIDLEVAIETWVLGPENRPGLLAGEPYPSNSGAKCGIARRDGTSHRAHFRSRHGARSMEEFSPATFTQPIIQCQSQSSYW